MQRSEASAPQARVEGSPGEFEPLLFEIVEDRKTSQLWTELIERHHYLRYRVPVGANLRYLVRSGQSEASLLACLSWSSPAWRMAARDQWIGWNAEQRVCNLQLIVNQGRFLVLPCATENLPRHSSYTGFNVVGSQNWNYRFAKSGRSIGSQNF
jgi:hypothetical protein